MKNKLKIKSKLITDGYFVTFYRSIMGKKKSRHKHIIMDKADILECQSLIWKVVRDHYVNNEGGVFLNNIGYLCHIIRPFRKLFVNPVTGDMSRKGTDGYKYNHTVFDFMPRNRFFHLYISVGVDKICKNLMNSGLRYKFLYREVDSERNVFGVNYINKL